MEDLIDGDGRGAVVVGDVEAADDDDDGDDDDDDDDDDVGVGVASIRCRNTLCCSCA